MTSDTGSTDVSTSATDRISFAIVGSGWRTEFFLRIARAMPDRFEVCGLVTRSDETGRRIEADWAAPTYRTIDELLAATSPRFVVVSVPRAVAPDAIENVARHGVAVLTETPPGTDVEAMLPLHRLVESGARIQVAEQYHLSPLLNAQLAIARSGRLGAISSARVAQCHDYHGVSILRRALGIGFEDAVITASRFDSPLTVGPGRTGDPTEEVVVTAHEVTARLDFGDQLGVYDFAGEQYFSWIRANRLLIRGDRGEISNTEVRFLHDFRTPMLHTIQRMSAGEGGNLEGQFLRGLIAGDEWVYRNEFLPARLSDDEIAIATCLVRMAEHADGGPDFYSLAEAAQDHYLALMIARAVDTGEAVRTEPQAWAR
ncbi:Gfo/Idh/MocA family protein [Planctomonas psychrotolerans]|uniref:Gfo/Idh/MocA family protein n=1 Tax=Planctomonas psychrotolerans TaxID=2528712 RepID=UPI00123A2DED|nr:Gfo/Idh/MocA family oxidoreductase [Planctomonas psychrotolerans]